MMHRTKVSKVSKVSSRLGYPVGLDTFEERNRRNNTKSVKGVFCTNPLLHDYCLPDTFIICRASKATTPYRLTKGNKTDSTNI